MNNDIPFMLAHEIARLPKHIISNACIESAQCFALERIDKNGKAKDIHFDKVATLLSFSLGGNFMVGRSSLVWAYSPQDRIYIVDKRDLADIREARQKCTELCGEENPPWSVAACSRRVMKDCYFSKGKSKGGDKLIEQLGWHYYCSKPGHYDYMFMHDMKSCYFHLFNRLPSLFPSITPFGVSFSCFEDATSESLRAMLSKIEHVKLFRNSLVGSLAASRAVRINRGKAYVTALPAHPLRDAALLVVATAFALCGEASATEGGVYSHTDCVVTASASKPKIWQDLGIPSEIKAQGETDIICLQNRKVGEDESDPYEATQYLRMENQQEHREDKYSMKWAKWLNR